MKLHHFNQVVIASLTASVLLAGYTATVSARDRDDIRRMESRTVQNRTPRQKQTPAPRMYKKNYSNNRDRNNIYRKRDSRVVRVLPRGYRTFKIDGRYYYSHNGSYYTRCDHGYRIVSTPRICRLPPHARRVCVNRTIYYVCDNVYYIPRAGYYEVCEAPVVRSSIEFSAGPVKIVLSDYDHVHY